MKRILDKFFDVIRRLEFEGGDESIRHMNDTVEDSVPDLSGLYPRYVLPLSHLGLGVDLTPAIEFNSAPLALISLYIMSNNIFVHTRDASAIIGFALKVVQEDELVKDPTSSDEIKYVVDRLNIVEITKANLNNRIIRYLEGIALYGYEKKKTRKIFALGNSGNENIY